jgi:hypothetical protein
MNGEREGLSQRTGLMSVLDTGAPGGREDHDYPRDPGLEADAGDVFFKVFELDAGRRGCASKTSALAFAYGIRRCRTRTGAVELDARAPAAVGSGEDWLARGDALRLHGGSMKITDDGCGQRDRHAARSQNDFPGRGGPENA